MFSSKLNMIESDVLDTYVDDKYFVFLRVATYETKMKWKSLLTGSFGQKNLPITKKYVCRNTQEKSLVFFYIRSA